MECQCYECMDKLEQRARKRIDAQMKRCPTCKAEAKLNCVSRTGEPARLHKTRLELVA